MSTTRIEASDGEHAVLHDFGGDGPPLLLTHGNGLNAGMWATVVPHLRERFHVYGLDFRGHGRSRPTHEPPSVDRSLLNEEVLGAIEVMGGGPIVAAGHSLGGATLVHTERLNPGTFERLWVFEPVIAPPGAPRPDGEHPLVVASRKRRMRFDSVEAAYDRFVSKRPYSECEPAAVRAYVELGTYDDGIEPGVRLSCAGVTEADIFASGVPIDFAELATVRCPTVVALGEAVSPGNEFPPMVAPSIAEALGAGSLLRMPGLTHFGPMEDGARVADAISTHLAAEV